MADTQKENNGETISQIVRGEIFAKLAAYLEKEGLKPTAFFHCSKRSLTKIEQGKQAASLLMLWRLERAFQGFSYRAVRNGKAQLPEEKDYGFTKRFEKLRYLDKFLIEKEQGLSLARALSLSERKWKNILSGETIPSRGVMKSAAVYFSLPNSMLLDDEVALPSMDQLKVDEDLAAVQRNDLAETMNYYQNKHYLARNYRVLSHPMRVKLYTSLLLILLPLSAFTAYCSYRIIQSRQDSLAGFAQTDIRDASSKAFEEGYIAEHTKDATNSQALTYCPVRVGTQVLKIYDIQPSNEYFSVALKVWFDFSQDDFHAMYQNYVSDPTKDDAPNALSSYTQDMDIFTVSRDDNSISYAPDSIPDYLELATPFDLANRIDWATIGLTDEVLIQETARKTIANASGLGLTKLRNNWIRERNSYPGLTPSTIYKDYSPNFDVGKGVDPTTLAYYYAPGEPYYRSNSKTGAKEYRMFQCCKFCCKVSKAYDNPRYPLETAQFWINITPSDWLNVDNVRYVNDPVVDVSRNQESGTSGYDYCSIDELVYQTMGDDVGFTDGFRSIQSDHYQSHAEAIEYDVAEYPSLSHSKLTVVVRANRAAFTSGNFLPSTFLQTYINLFAVIIWIIIAFFNQSYSGEDSLGMLSTGMFSTISATIVGFQMLSDASMFSLITMINIFTLAVILIMTYSSITAKRAQVKKDKAAIAYNGVKLRIMFYLLTLCTLVMFIGLPIAAYLWMV